MQQGVLDKAEMCWPTSANSEDLHVDEIPHHGLHYLLIHKASMFTRLYVPCGHLLGKG